MTTFGLGVSQRDNTGKVAPGIFAQEGRCWRFVYADIAGRGTHCMEPVTWRGRWRFTKGWTPVWTCERHADELPWARRIAHGSLTADGANSSAQGG